MNGRFLAHLSMNDETSGHDGAASMINIAPHFSVEIDNEPHDESSSDGSADGVTSGVPKSAAVARYTFLATLAVSMTVTCPGETDLWLNGRVKLYPLVQVAVVSFCTLVAFVMVHCSDPGFLSEEMLLQFVHESLEREALIENDEILEEEKLAGDPHSTPPTVSAESPFESQSDSRRNVNGLKDHCNSVQYNNNGMAEQRRRKFCHKCQFAPLLRSHHCKICQRCVATFDHHCKLVGVCIGERNRCIFWWFLLIQFYGFVTCCRILSSSHITIFTLLGVKNNGNNQDTTWDVLRVVIAKSYIYPLTLIAAIMLGMHSFFAVTNMTTFECVKGPKHLDYLKGAKDMDLPFSQGIVSNVRLYCSCSHYYLRSGQEWKPTMWQLPGEIVRDSEDWWQHPWQNKYWSCC